MNVERALCQEIGTRMHLCPEDALVYSCLNKPESCSVIVSNTTDTCSFAVATNEIAIHSS